MCAFVLFWVSFPDAWTAFASSEGGGEAESQQKTNTNSNPVNKKTHATVRGQYIRKIYRLFHGKQWSVPGLFVY